MGRLTGIEPAHIGATIQRVNHFTTAAIGNNNHTSYEWKCKDKI